MAATYSHIVWKKQLWTDYGVSYVVKKSTFGKSGCWVKFSSVTQSCLTLSDPMDCSTPGFPVPHQLLEFTQTHVRRVGDAGWKGR